MIAFSGHLNADKLPFDLLTCTCSRICASNL
jgi:hypothetical protein